MIWYVFLLIDVIKKIFVVCVCICKCDYMYMYIDIIWMKLLWLNDVNILVFV